MHRNYVKIRNLYPWPIRVLLGSQTAVLAPGQAVDLRCEEIDQIWVEYPVIQ